MNYQTEIEFNNRLENNAVSQAILDNNYQRIHGQIRLIFELLAKGERLTFDYCYTKYKIKHLPRRILDVEQFLNIKALRKYAKDGTATYFFNEAQQEQAEEILNDLRAKGR